MVVKRKKKMHWRRTTLAWVKVLGAERSFFPLTVTKRILKMCVALPPDDDLLGHYMAPPPFIPYSRELNKRRKLKVGRLKFVRSDTLLG